MSNNGFHLFSLFSGAGGLDLGFRLNSKYQLLFANDILDSAARTYSRNFAHRIVEIEDLTSMSDGSSMYLKADVSKIDFERIKYANVDILVGGPPCQDFSIVRGPSKERQGIDVHRGKLYSNFVRALMHLQPKVFVFENVPGLVSANKGLAYKIILEDFTALNVRWKDIKKSVGNNFTGSGKDYTILFSQIVNSAHFGVPQRRKRLIIIGARNDVLDWLDVENLRFEIVAILTGRKSLFKKYPLTSLEIFEGLPLPKLAEKYRSIMKAYKKVAHQVGTKKSLLWVENCWDNLSLDILQDYYTVNSITPSNSSEADMAFKEHESLLSKLGYLDDRIDIKVFPDGSNVLPKVSARVLERLSMIPPDENHLFVKGTKWEVEGRGMSLIYRRLHPLKPSYTVVAYGGGGTWGYHYLRERGKLTNRERARLQTFPDTFLFEGTTSEIRGQIGEAVPPFLGCKIAQIVALILNSAKT